MSSFLLGMAVASFSVYPKTPNLHTSVSNLARLLSLPWLITTRHFVYVLSTVYDTILKIISN